MRIEQRRWTGAGGWHARTVEQGVGDAQLVLVFGGTAALEDPRWLSEIRARHPLAEVVSCSTAGEISQTEVTDHALVATALHFERTTLRLASVCLGDAAESRSVGDALAKQLIGPDLRHVIVLSEGLRINGSELAAGFYDALPPHLAVTGGLAGDGDRMQCTRVGHDAMPEHGRVVAIGLYGKHLRVGYGSLGGWDPFGPERLVTRSSNNVLFELDGRSALALYKKYLGEHAAGLPATGLLFPLAVRLPGGRTSLVRTILGIDERAQSITFAGDVPERSFARLMRTNFDQLIDGAKDAARECLRHADAPEPELALLISCVGRKLLLGQRIEEEVEGVRGVLGESTVLAGFYSYGEICPQSGELRCELHNQTMTITTLREDAA